MQGGELPKVRCRFGQSVLVGIVGKALPGRVGLHRCVADGGAGYFHRHRRFVARQS